MENASAIDVVWNRALVGCEKPGPGDRALAALLLAHGAAMNGGIMHAVESLDPSEIAAAIAAYEYFGLRQAAALFVDVSNRDLGKLADAEIEALERASDEMYALTVESDSFLIETVERHYKAHPGEYAPVVPVTH
jgi:hypothetical protein